MRPIDYLHLLKAHTRHELAHHGRRLLGDLPSREELGAVVRHRSPGILVGGVLAGLLGTLLVRGRPRALGRAGALLAGLLGREAVRRAGRNLAQAFLAGRVPGQPGVVSSATQRR